jgi:hypothetical protein
MRLCEEFTLSRKSSAGLGTPSVEPRAEGPLLADSDDRGKCRNDFATGRDAVDIILRSSAEST